MPNPLTGDEHRHRAMELELDHLTRRRVQVPPQIAQQPARSTRLARAVAVAHPRRAFDALVGTHVVDERDEAVVEDWEVQAEDFFGEKRGGPPGLAHLALPLRGRP